MNVWKRRYWSVFVAVFVLVAASAVPEAAAQQQQTQGFGPPQQKEPHAFGPPQQQTKGDEWVGQVLTIVNTTNPPEPIEIHIKYRAKPCPNCEFVWMPSAPDKPGDITGRIEPGEKGAVIVLDGSEIPPLISRFIYWAKGLNTGDIWDKHTKEENAVWLVDPQTGLARSKDNLLPIFVWEIRSR